MTPQELKAVLAKTNEVAVYPIHIESGLPYWADQRFRRGNKLMSCPTGLIKATLIQMNAKWVEKRPVSACGDTDYEIQHRNGVLIEFPFSNQIANHSFVDKGSLLYPKISGKRSPHPYPHTEVVKRHGHKFVRMIVSHKVIGAPWNEYMMIEARRAKEKDERQRNYLEHRSSQAELMGMTLEEFEKAFDDPGTREVYLNADAVTLYEYNSNGSYKRGKDGSRIVKGEIRKIEITLDQAKKILSLLTDEQKAALRDTI